MTDQPKSAFATSKPAPTRTSRAEPPKNSGKFYVGEKHFKITITMWDAFEVLPKDFDVNIPSLFEGDNLNTLLARMFMSDTLAVQLIQHYSELPYEEIIQSLTPESLARFKDVWWAVVLDFFDQTRRESLREILKQVPQLMRTTIGQSLNETSEDGVSNSQEKQESIQEDTP